MSNINTAVQLYEMMAQRFEKTGWTPEQAAVYRKMATFMKTECATLEEATEKLKNSPLFLAPTVALMKDKIHAYIRAAQDDEIEGIEEVYRQKLAEIDHNPASIHDPAFFTEAHNIYIKYLMRLQFFAEIYDKYIELESNYRSTSHKYGDTIAGNNGPPKESFELLYMNFPMAFENLERYGGNFAECAKRPEFREVIPVSDQAYNNFVKDALFYRANPPDPIEIYNECEKQVESICQKLGNQLDTLCLEKLKTWKEKCGCCLVIAPPDEHGDYEYTEIAEMMPDEQTFNF